MCHACPGLKRTQLLHAALSCSLITCLLKAKIQLDQSEALWVKVEPRWMKYILAKGFIAVDGISLTVLGPAVWHRPAACAVASETSRIMAKLHKC